MPNCQNFPEFLRRSSRQSKKSPPRLPRRIGAVGKVPRPARPHQPRRDPSLTHLYLTPLSLRPRVRSNLRFPSRFLWRPSQHFVGPILLLHRRPQLTRIIHPSLTYGHNPNPTMTSYRLTKNTNIIYLRLTVQQNIRNSPRGTSLRWRKAFTCLHNNNNSTKSSISQRDG